MFENDTYERILDRMLARVPSKMDKREGSLIWDTHSPTALEFRMLYLQLENILNEAYGDTASREYLILRCRERGISPFPASQSTLKGVFTPATVDVLGKRFNADDLNFIVTEKISDGEYKVQCETPGIVGNQYLGEIIPIEYINGLISAELVEVLIPGEDEESTDALRQRYFDSFEVRAYGGNVKDYLEKTNSIPGVGGTKVTRVWNSDITPADMIPDSIVTSWYENIITTDLNPSVKVWLNAVYTAAVNKKLTTGGTVLLTIIDSDFNVPSATLIDTVQTAIDPEQNSGEGYGIAPIGHVVTVKGVNPVSVTVKTNITFDSGFSWSNLQNSIDTVISEYLAELRKEWADSQYLIVRISQIETRILSLTGVIDIQGTKINGTENNLTLGSYQVPVFGGASQ